MHKSVLSFAIALAIFGASDDIEAKAKKTKAGHKVKGSVELQYRSNTDIKVAPASGDDFDFAQLGDFGDQEDEEEMSEDEEDEDPFDDVEDAELDEDEIAEEGPIDEDGDGIDDLLDPDSEGAVDSQDRITSKFGLGHKYQFANGVTSWNNGLKLSSDKHPGKSSLNKINYAVTTGFDFAPKGSKSSYKTSVSYVTLEKDSSKFVNTFVVSLGYEYEVSKRFGLSATYNYQDKDVTKIESPDARIDTFAIGANFKATPEDIFKFKYAPKVEDSTEVTRNTDASGWELTYTRKLLWDMTAGLGYKSDTIEHKNLSTRREDDNRAYALQLTKDFSKSFGMAIGYETRKRDSNINGKDAKNRSVYIEGTYKFGGK